MIPSYTSVRAGASIENGDYVRLELDGDTTIAYPVESRHDRLLLPIAAEDAQEGELLAIQSRC